MFRYQPTRSLLQRAAYIRSQAYRPTALRPFTSQSALYAQKDAQDKDSLKPRSNEYSKSGSDDAAAHSDAAFDPSTTRPGEEGAEAKKSGDSEAGGNSLDASPGNKDISKPKGEQAGGAQGSPRTSSSGGGSAPKAGGNKSG